MSVSNGEKKMTRRDLYDWVISQGCEAKPIPEHKAKVIYFLNPNTGAKYWINLPINDTLVKDYTVYRTCCNLGIVVPDHVTYMSQVNDAIEKVDKKRKSRR